MRQVTEVNGRLWLMDGDYPWGTNLYSFDPGTGELEEFGGVTFELLDMVEFDNALWVTSHTDHLLIRIDPESGEMRRFPMPGKAGGLVVDASGSFWLTLYHPGALIRLDTDADLIESSPIVTDDWNRFPHRLLCTGSGESGGPTVILQPSDWIDYGSWSVIQAELSSEGHVVCSNGYLEGETTPQQQAADLEQALSDAGLSGPYVLAAAVDGVHAVRLFADGRDDIAGIVLVDPMPVGFQDFYDDLLPDLAGHPPWLDLDGGASQSLDDFGNVPLTVIEQDPDSVFQSRQFVEGFGREPAEAVNTYWQDGLAWIRGPLIELALRHRQWVRARHGDLGSPRPRDRTDPRSAQTLRVCAGTFFCGSTKGRLAAMAVSSSPSSVMTSTRVPGADSSIGNPHVPDVLLHAR